MKVVFGVSLVLVLVSFAAGCGGDSSGAGANVSALEGTPWVLAQGVDGLTVPTGVALSAMFEKGTVSGSAGCNRFTGPYTVDGEALDVGLIATTNMACAPPLDAVERAYLAALDRVSAWRSGSGGLQLLDAAGTELLRYEAASIAGEWEVTAFLRGAGFSTPVAGTLITATFAADGTLSGSGGCNNYTTTYTANRGVMTITAPASTRKLCPSPDEVMEQEAAFLAVLPTAASYELAGTSLNLLRADGTGAVSFIRASKG